DMAYGLRTGRPHRASGELTYHVLDVMHAFHDSSNRGTHVRVKSKCKRPAPLPLGLRDGLLDE
ncbi:MAG: gfo/Idh/MocA family oxidoreductase, partial [Candidatus Hydrogenedentes bacterium]|nr:gfo/Idh/MocA family oxidoreductase [Candidatus Hydrogenedentota bacterium]